MGARIRPTGKTLARHIMKPISDPTPYARAKINTPADAFFAIFDDFVWDVY